MMHHSKYRCTCSHIFTEDILLCHFFGQRYKSRCLVIISGTLGTTCQHILIIDVLIKQRKMVDLTPPSLKNKFNLYFWTQFLH